MVGLKQRVGRALDAAAVAQRTQDSAHQCGLARAKITVQVHHQTGGQRACKLGAQCSSCLFVGEGKLDSAMIGVMQQTDSEDQFDYAALAAHIRSLARTLGFQSVGISDIDLATAESGLRDWLQAGMHGDMDYMASHGSKRSRPDELLPGTVRVLSCRMDYWPGGARPAAEVLADGEHAYISRYALGRDYHKVMRARLARLEAEIRTACAGYAGRVFCDSAPVMEVALAEKAGLGWRGKHSLLLTREHGSWFFLGEIYLNLPLPVDAPRSGHCGDCRRCIDACPTGAIVAPYRVDARRCISYLTIEHDGSIPPAFRAAMGNRIYGCDDCQLVCPWNRFAQPTREADFAVRHGLDDAMLVELFAWDEATFQQRMAGSPIYRIGHARWLRNIAVALGNAPQGPAVVQALQARADDASDVVREHVAWALARHGISR